MPAVLFAVCAFGFTSCDDDPQLPPVIVPQATLKANTTILEVKKTYSVGSDVPNFIDTIGNLADGSHTIIKGRVVGNDVSGNISKYVMIQDETAALCFSIDAYDLSDSYHIGQEVIVDLTDMYIGKYNRQYLIGYPEWYADGNAWEAGRMPLALMQSHAQVNGLVDMSKVDTMAVTIPQIKAVKDTDVDNVLYWDQRLVKFENVYFKNGKKEQFAPYHKNNVVQTIVDQDGNEFPTYNSGYSDFYSDSVPAGYGTVVGIINYVGKDGWRLTLREKSDCVGFDPDAVNPAPAVLLDAPFTDGQGQFTIDNVDLPDGVSAVWTQDSKYGMKATSYVGGTNYKAESWLVSPVIDFTEAAAPYMIFEQAFNYFADIAAAKKEASVWVRVEGGSWQELTVPAYPEKLSWDFISSGRVGLDAAKGKKAQIGFKYVGTATRAGTWELKNLKVYAN